MATTSCSNKNTNKSEGGDAKLADSLETAMESLKDESSIYLLVGTYTSGESEGIYVYQFDTISGYSKYINKVKVANPSYLAVSKDEKYVYAVSENGDNTDAASAFAFDKSNGTLKLINSQPTGGAAPCYITIDNGGKHLATANYLGGSITVFGIKEDGSIDKTTQQVISFTGKSTDPKRQTQPHLHCVTYSPDEKFLFADDLGTDKIYKFNINTSEPGEYIKIGTPAFVKVADGSGPRHLTFHPNNKYAYLINEISGTVTTFDYNNGNLTEKQTIKADTLNAQGSADIHTSPDGKYLYASNRLKGDGIAIFSINQSDGTLTKIAYQETGIHPRNFVITPNGNYLLAASRDSDIIQIFAIDKHTGLLENTYKDIKLDMPVCLKFASFR